MSFVIVNTVLNLGVNLVKGLVVAVVGSGMVLVERGGHCTVAFPKRVYVAKRDCEHNCVIKHISHVQIVVGIGNDEQVVGLVVVVVTIFHGDVICGVNLMVKGVKATVTRDLEHSLASEGAVVGIILLYKVKMNVYVRRQDIRILHIFEELCVTFEVLLIFPVFQGRKLNFILRKLSHFL